MWAHLKRIIKPNGAIVLTASQPFTTTLIASNMGMFKYCWVWDKKKAGNIFLAKYQPMKTHEDVLVFGVTKCQYFPIMVERENIKKSRNYGTGEVMGGSGLKENELYTYTHKFPVSIIEVSNANQSGKHQPTQKPVALMEYLIRTYTNKGDTVLDFTMGSGTTGVACVNLDRDFIGIELDPDYFAIAEKRIAEAEMMPKQMELI